MILLGTVAWWEHLDGWQQVASMGIWSFTALAIVVIIAWASKGNP